MTLSASAQHCARLHSTVETSETQGRGHGFNVQEFQAPILKRKRKRDDLDEDTSIAAAATTTSTSSSQKRAVYVSRPKEQRDERQRAFYERLAATNGVVIPSKLAPGETAQPKDAQTEDRKYQCPICHGWHKKRDHVKSHFAKCVEMYGNPNGVRWDDAWESSARRANSGSASVSDAQNDQTQAPRPEAYMLAGTPFDDSATANFQLNGYQPNFQLNDYQPNFQFNGYQPNFQFNGYQPNSQLNDYQPNLQLNGYQPNFQFNGYQPNLQLNGYQHHSVSSALDGFENQQPDVEYPDLPLMFNPLDSSEHYDPDISHLEPRLRPVASDSSDPRNENLGMGSLTNGTLLSRFHHWHEVICDGQKQLQQTKQELEHRGMLDANGTWVVDLERVNMALTRGEYSVTPQDGSMW